MSSDTTHHVDHDFTSRFERSSGLLEWVFWFVILATSCLLILASVLLPGLVPVSTEIVFYWLITIVAISTLGRSFYDAAWLSKETKLASEQVRQLVDLDDIGEFLKVSRRSVFRSHIESLYTIFQVDHDIKQDSLIELLHDRLLARNRVSELFSSILITLGLVGTIVGLIAMVSNLRQSMEGFVPGESENLIGDLMGPGGALQGLDTAFYTTLLGALFGGVMLRVLTNVVGANITRYSAHVAELTEVNVLPAMRSIARELERSGYYGSSE